MEVKNLDQAVRDILANKRESLSEEYRTKLDEYIDRTTNPNHLIKLLNEEDLEKALDERSKLGILGDKTDVMMKVAAAEAMKEAAKNLEFEEAMQLRDIIFELKSR